MKEMYKFLWHVIFTTLILSTVMLFILLSQKPTIKLPPPPPPDQIMNNINGSVSRLNSLLKQMKTHMNQKEYKDVNEIFKLIKDNKNVLNYTTSKPMRPVCDVLKTNVGKLNKFLKKFTKDNDNEIIHNLTSEIIKELTQIDVGVDNLFLQNI